VRITSVFHRWKWVVLATLAIATSGCGQRELSTLDVRPKQGTLTMGGEPVRYFAFYLEPVDGKGIKASGRTDGFGRFELFTYSNYDPDGAAPGEYKLVPSDELMANTPKGETATAIPSEFPELLVVIENNDNELAIDIPT